MCKASELLTFFYPQISFELIGHYHVSEAATMGTLLKQNSGVCSSFHNQDLANTAQVLLTALTQDQALSAATLRETRAKAMELQAQNLSNALSILFEP